MLQEVSTFSTAKVKSIKQIQKLSSGVSLPNHKDQPSISIDLSRMVIFISEQQNSRVLTSLARHYLKDIPV